MGTFMTRVLICVYLGIGVIMGSVIKMARRLFAGINAGPPEVFSTCTFCSVVCVVKYEYMTQLVLMPHLRRHSP